MSANVFADTERTLVVNFHNGASQSYNLRETMTIRQQSDSLVISSSHMRIAYKASAIAGYRFSADDAIKDGIDTPRIPNSEDIRFEREDNVLRVIGMPDKSRIRIFAVNSTEMTTAITYSGNTATVSLASLPQGVYIIHLTGMKNAPSIKITK